jgi:prevent-host-death family protein
MHKENIHQAKSTLSKLIQEALAGEEVVICKAGIPLVRLAPYKSTAAPRTPGLLKGQIWMADDFIDTPDVVSNKFMESDL